MKTTLNVRFKVCDFRARDFNITGFSGDALPTELIKGILSAGYRHSVEQPDGDYSGNLEVGWSKEVGYSRYSAFSKLTKIEKI